MVVPPKKPVERMRAPGIEWDTRDRPWHTWAAPCETRAAVAVEDLPEGGAALAALYEATGGANWKNNYNWLSGAPLGEWYGITTDSIGRVIGLDLSGNQLSGEVPPELGSFSNLQWLYLYGNQLSGCVPEGLRDVPDNDFAELGLHLRRRLSLSALPLLTSAPEAVTQRGTALGPRYRREQRKMSDATAGESY